MIPADLNVGLVESLGADALPRWAAETLVLAAVGEGRFTTGYAAELLALGYFQFLTVTGTLGIPQTAHGEGWMEFSDAIERLERETDFRFPGEEAMRRFAAEAESLRARR